jgi:transcriptional regulator with XRE-family HTH domain
MMKNTLGRMLKKARLEQGLTQEKLEKISGIKQDMISQYENDKVVPSLHKIRSLSLALKLSVDSMISKLPQEEARAA